MTEIIDMLSKAGAGSLLIAIVALILIGFYLGGVVTDIRSRLEGNTKKVNKLEDAVDKIVLLLERYDERMVGIRRDVDRATRGSR